MVQVSKNQAYLACVGGRGVAKEQSKIADQTFVRCADREGKQHKKFPHVCSEMVQNPDLGVDV